MRKSTGSFLFFIIFLFSCQTKGFDGEVVLQWETTEGRTEDVKVIEKRLKKMGIEKFTIQIVDDKTIKVEAKNVKDTLRFIRLVEANAELGFWETYENGEVFSFLEDLNRRLGVGVSISTTTEPGLMQNDSARIRANPLWSYLQIALYTDEQGRQVLKPGPEVGWCKDTDTAYVDSLLRIGAKTVFPRDLALFWTLKPLEFDNDESSANNFFGLIALKKYSVASGAFMTQSYIKESKIEDGYNGGKILTLTFDKEGTKMWEKMTRKNIGRSIAITLDDKVISYPNVESAIIGGRASITGPDPEELKTIQMGCEMVSYKTQPRVIGHHFEKKEK